MNISQTTLRIGAVLGTIGAIVVLAALRAGGDVEARRDEYRVLGGR